jgi:hypothetical protein
MPTPKPIAPAIKIKSNPRNIFRILRPDWFVFSGRNELPLTVENTWIMMALWQAHNKKEEFDAARPSSSGARSGKAWKVNRFQPVSRCT